jgi:broad specificity phosphatase PhoE
VSSSSPEIWLLRHAQTEWSVSGRHTGRTDIPLTDEGRQHAARTAPKIAGHRWAAVLSSPLGRARETAALAGLGDRAVDRDDLLEWDYGDYEGVTTAEIQETRPGWSLWSDGCPGGEQAADVGARVDRVIAEALEAGGDVAIFAHGHVLRVLGARWLEQPPAFGGRLALSTASICVLGFEHGLRVTWRWNDA